MIGPPLHRAIVPEFLLGGQPLYVSLLVVRNDLEEAFDRLCRLLTSVDCVTYEELPAGTRVYDPAGRLVHIEIPR